jgi:hypothetical protein
MFHALMQAKVIEAATATMVVPCENKRDGHAD